MSADANQEQTQTETSVTETPSAQPATQGSESPTQTPEPAAGSAQQAQGAHQQPPMIPKWRLDEVLEQNRQLKAQMHQQPQQPAQPKAAEDGRPKQGDFETYEDFIRADTRYETRQEFA